MRIAEDIERFVGHVDVDTSTMERFDINEFDLLVSLGPFGNAHRPAAPPISAIHLLSDPRTAAIFGNDSRVRKAESRSRHWNVVDTPFAAEVEQDLSHWAAFSTSTEEQKTDVVYVESDGLPVSPRDFGDHVGLSLATNEQGDAILGAVTPALPHEKATVVQWFLPAAASPARWTRIALSYLAELDPDRYPVLRGWNDLPEYMTADEVSAASMIAELKRKRAETLREIDQQLTEQHSALQTATNEAEGPRGWRRLVTTYNQDLVDVVSSAFQELGFQDVINPDASRENQGKRRREDLRISQGDKVCLVEVKGLPGGAQERAISQLQRHATTYAAENGREPYRLWHVVNQFRGRPPGERHPPFVQAPELVAEFAEAGGLVIDTAQLLELILDVAKDKLSADDARATLWHATGTLAEPPHPHNRHRNNSSGAGTP